MIDEEQVFERVMRGFVPPDDSLERLVRRRDRKRRNQRITAGVVGIAVFVAAVWIVTSVGWLGRSEKSGVPAGRPVQTGPAETGPKETGPLIEPGVGPTGTGPAETGPLLIQPGVAKGENPEPVQIGTVTRSGAGCALEFDAEPIPSGCGQISVVNETNRRVSFNLYRLRSRSHYAQFETFVAEAEFLGGPLGQDPPGVFLLVQRDVGPGASGTFTDNFTTGDAFAVVCLDYHPGLDIAPDYAPFAVVGPFWSVDRGGQAPRSSGISTEVRPWPRARAVRPAAVPGTAPHGAAAGSSSRDALGVVRNLPGRAGAALHPTISPRPRRPEPSRWPGGEQDRSWKRCSHCPRGGRWTGHRGRAEHDARPSRRRPRTRTGRPPANASLDLRPLDLDGGVGLQDLAVVASFAVRPVSEGRERTATGRGVGTPRTRESGARAWTPRAVTLLRARAQE